MPEVTHENSWNEILKIYQAGEYTSSTHLQAEAALKVKLAKATVENQENMLEVQKNILKSQERVGKANLVLPIFTIAPV